ncbi:MAG: hypothetical protein J0H22_15495 [Actinobacteria bacterium]|nr:hypothetical protein [Actinomycetota bacterium]
MPRSARQNVNQVIQGSRGFLQVPLTGEQYALGIHGGDHPTETVIDFARHPVLAIHGNRTDQTTALRHLIRSITARRSGPEQAALVIFDINGRLSDETSTLHTGDHDHDVDYYETYPADIAERLQAITTLSAQRAAAQDRSPKDRGHGTASDPTIYLVIDDIDALPSSIDITAAKDRAIPQFFSLGECLESLRNQMRHNIGLRIIYTTARTNALTALTAFSPKVLRGQTNTITFGTPTNGPIGRRDYDANLPPGAGHLEAADPKDNCYLRLAVLDDRIASRRRAIETTAGSLAGTFAPRCLNDQRQDWPNS